MIRRYPGRKDRELYGAALAEQEAVQKAINDTKRKVDGEDRMRLISLVYWKNCKIPAAALRVPCSERTALRWNGDFVRLVAKKRGLTD